MATPIVENEYGSFRYDTQISRWICTSGKIPGGGAGPHTNCCVYLSYAGELSAAARKAGFTSEDFGVVKKTVKVKKPRLPGRRKSKSREIGETLFDFSE